MQVQQPVAFEISLERSTDISAPAIKQRLEQSPSRKPITIDDI